MISPEIADSRFKLHEKQAESLARQFGTPLYVIDEAHFRARIQRYIGAFKSAWPNSELTYASKANSTLGVLAIAASEGCLIDAASEGEFRAALAAGVPASRCHLHGNNKSRQELEFAFARGIGQIVLDNFAEIELVAELAKQSDCPELVLRLAPGVDPVTHAKISTGQADTKFGFNLMDGAAERALLRCLELGLPVVGFHCHVGSQLLDPGAQISGGELLAEFAARMLKQHQFTTRILNVGGGLGVYYTDSDNPMAVEMYCQNLCDSIRKALAGTGLDPKLTQEPGRSLIAESGITLYRVGVRKTVPSQKFGVRTYLAVDGGLSDNPRPVMYGSKYTVLPLRSSTAESQAFTISGKHCETDMLFEQVPLPSDIEEGDLVQVLCTGAYNSSMASNYNRYPRPATALIRLSGDFHLLQRQDNWDEMFARELVPEGLQS